MLKYFALLSMLVDHIGAVLYNREYYILSAIGRFAFPIFAFILVKNYLFRTSSIKKYSIRLFLFGLLSQPVFYVAFNKFQLNIFFTLLTGLIFLYSLDKKDYILTFLTIIASLVVEYNLIAIFLFFSIYNIYKSNTILSYIILYIAIFILLYPKYIIVSPLLFLIIIESKDRYFITYLENKYSLNLNIKYNPRTKYLFYIFYPLHIAFLVFLKGISNV